MDTGLIIIVAQQEGQAIFSGLAHWIKGAIFFWYGILTLGRWSGSFGELGWVSSFGLAVPILVNLLLTPKKKKQAWNVRPKLAGGSRKWRPTAEFVEGFLIFFYGSTNIFLEHLVNAGQAFSPQDLEHISITVLFIGGGAVSSPSSFAVWYLGTGETHTTPPPLFF